MRVSVVAVGKARGALAPAIREYEERAARYWRLEVVEVAQARDRAVAQVLRREADGISGRLRPGYQTVALTRAGNSWSSRELARWLVQLAEGPARGVHFLIGGAFGIAEELREGCRLSMSLSAFTLPHDVARLVLAEQLYRAGTILRNEPYHKGPK